MINTQGKIQKDLTALISVIQSPFILSTLVKAQLAVSLTLQGRVLGEEHPDTLSNMPNVVHTC